MSVLTRIKTKHFGKLQYENILRTALSSNADSTPSFPDQDEFPVLRLIPEKSTQQNRTARKYIDAAPPRANEMPVDQDWASVWPSQRTFHPNVVPLPIRQGYPRKGHPIPSKYANAELMKIPNFLHLTPPAIKRHCEALKKFCNPWPKGLETDEKCGLHFPLEIITSDYCYSSPSIREPLARIVNIRVKLSSLTFDQHAKDKFLRLVGNRYNSETDYITITADRCPLRKQNLEYAEYLLTAVYNESWRVEPWEAEKALADMEYYDWEKNQSKTNLITIFSWPEPPTDTDYEKIPHATEYKIAVSDLINNGEDEYSINKYKEAVKNLFNLEHEEFEKK